MADLGVGPGEQVLLVWTQPMGGVKGLAEDLAAAVGAGGTVAMENMERLLRSSRPASSFHWILSGLQAPCPPLHPPETLQEMVRLLRPGGTLVLEEPVTESEARGVRTAEKLVSTMKLSGFVSVREVSKSDLTPEALSSLKATTGCHGNTISRVRMSASKPNYEIGSSAQITLGLRKKAPPPPAEKADLDMNTVKMWTLSANDMDDEDVDLLDSDALLDEDDLKKPDPSSLRAPSCRDAKKKKACKNCTCGLAEELQQESDGQKKRDQPKSACGSCYLGDAFRCASCPYLGMPAFRPGEKIVLDAAALTDA